MSAQGMLASPAARCVGQARVCAMPADKPAGDSAVSAAAHAELAHDEGPVLQAQPAAPSFAAPTPALDSCACPPASASKVWRPGRTGGA